MDFECMVQCFVLDAVVNYSNITPTLWSLVSLLLGCKEGKFCGVRETQAVCEMLHQGRLRQTWAARRGLNNQFNNIIRAVLCGACTP